MLKAPEKRIFTGRFARVEPLDLERHAADLYRASHESDEARRVWQFLPDGPFADLAAFGEWATRMMKEPDRLVFATREQRAGRLAGMAMYFDTRPAHGTSEIGYIWFAPFAQRTPAATEALYLMLQHAFDDLRYRRMQWRCNALNEKSRAAAVRLGFRFEGIFRQHMLVKGTNRDTAWYSIIDSEWPRLRANFDRWLAPDNFDSQGRQRTSLRDLNASHAVC